MRQFLNKFSGVWWRHALVLLVAAYFSLGLGLLAVRYLLSPALDNWRPQIADQISRMTDTRASLGQLSLTWRGWNPHLQVQDLRLADENGQTLLLVPDLSAHVNWTKPSAGVLSLQVRGLDIDLDRLPDGRLRLLGQTLERQDDQEDDFGASPWLSWVLAQPLIAFQDSTLRWRDYLSGSPELVLENVQAELRHQDGQALGLSLSARAPAVGAATLDARLLVSDGDALVAGLSPEHWQAWLRMSQAKVADWRPWLALPSALRQGRLDAQLWLQSGSTQAQLTALLNVVDLSWGLGAEEGLRVPKAAIWAQGDTDQWRSLLQDQVFPRGLAFDARTRDVSLVQSEWFEQPLATGAVALRGQLRRDDEWRLQVQRLDWRNDDIELRGQGSWNSRGEAGQIDFQGGIARAELNAIHRYLPLEVDADVREWLAKGLRAGTLRDARWLLQGDLIEFPFGEQPQAGDFRVAGNYSGARIEFMPDAPAEQAWPLLQDMVGTADLHRMDLRLTASQAVMQPVPDQTIKLWGLRAHIPNLEENATLQVSGRTAAGGDVYMALLQHSPLGPLLDGLFDEAVAAGDWQVPLSLTIPLLDTDETLVQGRVDVQDASLRLLPQAPAFEAMTGSVHFNEQGIRLAQPLTAKVLGGNARMTGALGGKDAKGLAFRGRITADALNKFVDVPGMQRITGRLDYRAGLRRQGNGYLFDLQSDTDGLALDFPAPLSKPARQPATLQLQWTDADPQVDQLTLRLADDMRVDLQHLRKSRKGPYFQQVAVGIGTVADTLEPGLRVAFHYPLIDLDVWNRIVDEFSIPRRGREGTAAASGRPLWPDLTRLSLQADQLRLLGTRLDQAVMRVTRTPEEYWSLNLHSKQTAGTLKWQERDGRIAGRMAGHFDRLSLGDDAEDTGSLLPEAQIDQDAALDEDLDIPGIILQADDLRLYGHSVGALTLEGARDGRQHIWRLDRLEIGTEAATLKSNGVWRLQGEDRGLSLKSSVDARNFGAWLAHAGFPDVMSGGEGTLKGQWQWRNLPWSRDQADLSGKMTVSLDKGRFLQVGSHTGKLLEILSLQSLTRLNRLDQGLTGLSKDGFPFDQLRGDLELNQGNARIQDYKVIGPVATILLEGSSNILNQTLDLQAVIVPNLDVSGAALAAGIAVNPLVGLGAFVTQWLLKTPLAKAMTVRYHVTGTWDEPSIQDMPVNAAATSSNAGSSR